ncbi:MAG: hypothetical protein ACAH07_06045 [Methylophilaceae bacterium]|nr:hypothetical protein [Methyloradius sp.]
MSLPFTPPPLPTRKQAGFSDLFSAWLTWFVGIFIVDLNNFAANLSLTQVQDTSSSSLAIGTGAKVFAVSAGKGFVPGMYLVMADTSAPSSNSMVGQVVSYLGTTLTMNITSTRGSGTVATWTISQSAPGGDMATDTHLATAKTTPVDADEVPLVDSAASFTLKKLSWASIKAALSSPVGQCRLSKSGANLMLLPYNGNKLMINGVLQAIPAAGVTLAPPATTLTLYYIYAYMVGAVITLEASATGHSTDATTGVEIKTGDATRTLVGMARTVTNAWVDTAQQRFVRSWFFDAGIFSNAAFTANKATTSTALVELDSTSKLEVLLWAEDLVSGGFTGSVQATGGGQIILTTFGVDSTSAAEDDVSYVQIQGVAADLSINKPCGFYYARNGFAEGYHYFTILGSTSSGTTATWVGNATAGSARSTSRISAKKA